MDDLSTHASTFCLATTQGQSVTLLSQMTPAEFRRQFTARVRKIREALGWERQYMADQMGVSKDKWIKYETRTPLPHYLIAKFCHLTKVEVWFLFTGDNAGKSRARPETKPNQLHSRRDS